MISTPFSLIVAKVKKKRYFNYELNSVSLQNCVKHQDNITFLFTAAMSCALHFIDMHSWDLQRVSLS